MQTYENKGADIYTNGSAGHMNGAELTRMKEVAFEKNPSEPMVRHLPPHKHTHTHTHTHLIFVHIYVAGSSSLNVFFLSAGSHSEAQRQTKVYRGQNTARGHDP